MDGIAESRAMRALIPLVLVSVALAGCLGATESANLTNDTAAPEPLNVSGVQRYDSNDSEIAIYDLTAQPWTRLTGQSGAEPTMGISDSGAIFITGSTELHRSTDGGQSWENVYSAINSNDPLMDYDHSTDTVYMDPMAVTLACTELAWSTDDGESWTTNPTVCHPPPMDHQKLFSGPPSPDAPQAGLAADNVLYQCYNQLLDTVCATSYDGGITWANTQVVADQYRHGCGGTNGFGEVGPNGTAAVPMSDDCEQIAVAVTHDSGVAWELSEGPSEPGARFFDPEVDFGADGTMYVMWPGSDHGMHLARSPDQGGTWEGPWDLTPPGVGSTMFPTFNVGADGKAAFAFLGTKDTDAHPDDAPEDAIWNLYTVTTDDVTGDDPTLTSYRMTDDPVQVGRICTGGFLGCPDGKRNLLEFIDSSIHPNGTFNIVYTDGCVDDCAENPASDTSTARQLGLARLDGWTMTREDW